MKVLPFALLLALTSLSTVAASDTDQFTYGDTDVSGANNIYGPSKWDKVQCDTPGECAGWPDQYALAYNWTIDQNGNACTWCPVGATQSCGLHHGSPIDLEREKAIIGSEKSYTCIDLHWMKYEDSSCSFDNLVDRNAFSIERHALKVTQPLQAYNNSYRLDCLDSRGRRFGQIDFSKGFSDKWWLSHTDFKVPSEHTQGGVRYSAEVQMAHFYSLYDPLVKNEMAHVAVFLQAYDDIPPYLPLDRLICQWRRAEDRIRELCGLPSVFGYPGCFPLTRDRTNPPSDPPMESPKPSASPVPSTAPVSPTGTPSTTPFVPASLPPVEPEIEPPSRNPANTREPSMTPIAVITLNPSFAPMGPSLAPTLSAGGNGTTAPTIVGVGTTAPTIVGVGTTAPTIVGVGTTTPTATTTGVGTATPTVTAAGVGTTTPTATTTGFGTMTPTSIQAVDTSEPQLTVAPISQSPLAAGGFGMTTSSPTATSTSPKRNLRATSAQDVIQANYAKAEHDQWTIGVDDDQNDGYEKTDEEWDQWIMDIIKSSEISEKEGERELLEGTNLFYNNYQFLIDCRTEYYFRYSGTQTVPPCHGPFTGGTRGNTNHWRVLKDPIRVNPRQILEMERLLKERIAPPDDPFRACKADTAGIVDENGRFSVARPLQSFSPAHYETFCECENWGSKWPEDRKWCAIENKTERFFSTPYNFDL